ncbi:MAG: hypothetical protein JRZ94_03830 [Nitrososphaerota archaeon]|nr:hypothetical protein [Nitrososphaerota archaeon]
MASRVTGIAFIEYTLNGDWETLFGFPHHFKKETWAHYQALNDGARLSLVDLGNNRRYFSFKKSSTIQIVNNVVTFTTYDAEELAIDESKQFPKNQRIDE